MTRAPIYRPAWLWPLAWLAGLVALGMALAWDGGAAANPAGAGAIVRWGLPLASALAAACGAATIGALVLVICVLPRDAPGHDVSRTRSPKTPPRRAAWLACLRVAANAAGLWTLASITALVLKYASTSGEGLTSPGFANGLIYYATSVTSGRSLALSMILAAATFLAAVFMRSYIAVAWTEALAVVALLPLAASGHAAGSGGHMVAMSAAFLQLVSGSMWLGSLIAFAALWRRVAGDPALAPAAIGRVIRLGRWCFVLLVVAGIAAASVRLSSPAQLFTTRYGQVMLLEAVALLALAGTAEILARRMTGAHGGANETRTSNAGRANPAVAAVWPGERAGAAGRSSDIDQVVRGGDSAGPGERAGAAGRKNPIVQAASTRGAASRPVSILLSAQVAIVAILFGLQAGLAAGKAPIGDNLAATRVEQLTGYALPPYPTYLTYLTQWHLDVLLGTACVAGAIVYVRWVVRLQRRGDSWAAGRTASWLAGLALMFWVCDGGPVVYGHLLFSAHMILHMVVAMVIPILLCLGAPITLLTRAIEPRTDGSRGPREWMLALVHSRVARFFSHPIPASINFVGSMIIFYFTPLFALAMSTHLGHIAMVLHFTLAGYLFANLLIGIDPGPNRPAYPVRLLLLFCTMAFHAFFGIAIISSATILAQSWFDQLGTLYGMDRLADQATGGAITWGIGEIPTLVLAVALAVAWTRADERLAKRQDRAASRDGDQELKDYNRMLARLAERDAVEESNLRGPGA